MTALALTVFLASLTGSLHCAGMCGAFVAFAVDPRASSGPRARFRLQLAYHGGRLATYLLLGALAGWVGSALDLGGAFFGIQRAALLVAGAAMVLFGSITLLRLAGVRIPRAEPPAPFRTLFLRLHRLAVHRPPTARALAIGLLSTLLPCGWLYAFAITAAGSGSMAAGALTMAFFWLGTLPVLVGVGLGFQKLAGPLRRRVPVLTAVALMVVGLVAVADRFDAPPLAVAAESGPGRHGTRAPAVQENAPGREAR